MRNSLLAALMAATVLVPAAATAQDDHQGHGGGRGDGTAQRTMPNDGSAPRAERPQREAGRSFQPLVQAQAQAQVQPPVQAQPQFQQRDRGDRGDQGNRSDARNGFRGARPVQMQQQQQAQQATPDRFRGGGDRTGYRGGQGVVTQDYRRTDGRRTEDRRDERRDDDRTYGGRGNQGYQGYIGTRGYNGGNQAWSRDWRRDNHYNYSVYRNQNRNAFRLPRYYAPYGWSYGYRRFSIGFTLSSILYDQDYWIDDTDYYRLPPAYGPYRWVRYYNDALLVDLRSGYVVDTVYDIFW